MQRQKTIAKWIAVILLCTLCVGSYLAINAIENGKFENQNSANAQQSPVTKPTDKPTNVQPVYSVFPRENCAYQNASVAHIGGKGNDQYLASVYFADRLYVIFESDSQDYDVKQRGIHIAIFDKNTTSNQFDLLKSTQYIVDNSHKFLCASTLSNSIFLMFSTSSQTATILLNEEGKVSARNTLPLYTEATTYMHNNQLHVFASDGKQINALKLHTNLQYSTSNFVYSSTNCVIKNVVAIENEFTLSIQEKSDVKLLTFSYDYGFRVAHTQQGDFLQLLPICDDTTQSFLLASATQYGVKLSLISTGFKTKTRLIENENVISLRQQDNYVLAIGALNTYTFCTHLDLMSQEQTIIDGAEIDKSTCKTFPINGISPIVVFEDKNSAYLCIVKEQISLIFDFGKINANFEIAEYQNVITAFFECTATNAYAYQTFGLNDVFVLSIPL